MILIGRIPLIFLRFYILHIYIYSSCFRETPLTAGNDQARVKFVIAGAHGFDPYLLLSSDKMVPQDTPNHKCGMIKPHLKSADIFGQATMTMKKRARKRPWRQAIRHKAKRELKASRIAQNGVAPDASIENPAEKSATEPLTKQQKYKNRKKRKRLAKALAEERGKDEEHSGIEGVETADRSSKDPVQRLQGSRFRFLNEKLYTLNSKEAVRLFGEDQSAYEAYHKGYRQQMKKWPVHPVDQIILDLSALPDSAMVADIGCGDAKISAKLGDRLQVHSFDLVAINERVTVADAANLPLKAGSVDACVFCLSLMGTNLAEFLREAHRVLKMNGKMRIAEVKSRFRNVLQFMSAIEKMGFRLNQKKDLCGSYFVLMTFEKVGRIANRRPLGLALNPCLYKKR